HAEDGIRDLTVTGVRRVLFRSVAVFVRAAGQAQARTRLTDAGHTGLTRGADDPGAVAAFPIDTTLPGRADDSGTGRAATRSAVRSEERRVGKGCASRCEASDDR